MRTGAHNEPKEHRGSINPLVIGEDYAKIFGADPAKGQHVYYAGGIAFRAVSPKGERTAESQQMYDSVIDTINRVEVSMGRP